MDPSVPMSFVMSAGLSQVETSTRFLGGITAQRYTLVQNCFRYFDIDSIGTSDIHLSLFKMPGAFTFGEIDKKRIVSQLYSLITDGFGFDSESLWVTYFSGGNLSGHWVEPDIETYEAWVHAGIPQNQIVGYGIEHNFWKQSARIVGTLHAPKCGPHTEVFFCREKPFKCSLTCGPTCTCGHFVEIVNTLFITMNLANNNEIKLLDNPFSETVIGAERVSMLMQKVSSVFEIDTIAPFIRQLRQFIPNDISCNRVRHERIIVDHFRAIVFLISDGAPPPGKGGRARLMRKLIRRMLTSQKILNITNTSEWMKSLFDTAVSLYLDSHPNRLNCQDQLFSYVLDEEERFEATLRKGCQRLSKQFSPKSDITGNEMVVFEKKFGIPLPLLKAQLEKNGIQFSSHSYYSAYEQWRHPTT